MKYSEKVSERLNELLEKNHDAEKGYLDAAKHVKNKKLEQFFKERAAERSQFAKNLRTEILSYGHIPEDSGTTQGAVHRNWMALKSLFTANDEAAIIEESIRGEQNSLNEYTNVLSNDDFAPATRQLLEKQQQKIQAAINSLKYHEHVVS